MKRNKIKIISGKDLGQLALKDFCPRCFWVERKLGKAPGIFPGIFSTIDSLTKKSVKRSYLERNRLPEWLPLKNAVRPVEFPRISIPMFKYGGWVLTGDPDEVFEMDDGSYHIVDYKTARFTHKQDELLPMYQVQLNAYALALPVYNIKPITKLSLLYCEPKEELDSDEKYRNYPRTSFESARDFGKRNRSAGKSQLQGNLLMVGYCQKRNANVSQKAYSTRTYQSISRPN